MGAGGVQEISVYTPVLGDAGAYATGAALAVVLAWVGPDAPWNRVASAIQNMKVESGRLAPVKLDSGALLLDDSYNANPASMAASMQAAAQVAEQLGRRLVLVLGEMRELGAASEKEHDRMGEVAVSVAPRLVVGVCGHASHICAVCKAAGLSVEFFATSQQAAALAAGIRADDVVLVKGSRGVALEHVVRALAGRAGGP